MDITKKIHNVMYPLIIVLTALIIAIIAYNGHIEQNDIASSLLALLGTFLGATFAFRLNEHKEQQKIAENKRVALNRALFVLSRQYNAVKCIYKLMKNYKSDLERAFNLPAYLTSQYTDLNQNFSDLEFLLELEDPNILLRLTIEQERFEQAFRTLETRSQFYVHQVQPTLFKFSLNGELVNELEIRKLLGDLMFEGAINHSRNIYFHFEASIKSLILMQSEIFLLAKKIYPNYKFVKLEE